MRKEEKGKRKAKLSLIAALRYFLKGNMIFALNGIVLYAIETVFQLFPPLFQQVFTDNIITHKNPEWFTCSNKFLPTISSPTRTRNGLPH